MLDSSSLYIASVVLPVPPFFRLATTPHVWRQPTDVFVAQISHQEYWRERNTGHGDFEFSILAGQAAEPLRGRAFARPSLCAAEPLRGAACPCGARGAPPPERMCWACCSLTTVRHPVAGTHPARERTLPSLRPLPCPAGQGALRVCAFDAVCPAGKDAAEWRAGFFGVSQKETGSEAFCPSGYPTGAPENGPRAFPCREWSCVPSRRRNTPSPAIPSTSSARSKGSTRHVSPPSLFVASIRRVRPGYLPHKIPAFRPSRRRLIPLRSRRENGGLCPHPLKGPDP